MHATERELSPTAQAKLDGRPVKSLRFSFAIDEINKSVLFDEGPFLSGAEYAPLKILSDQHAIDTQAGLRKEAFVSRRTSVLPMTGRARVLRLQRGPVSAGRRPWT